MNSTTKTVLNLLLGGFFLAGAIFFLQGINVLPGSYMTGDPQWAINGGVTMIVTLSLFWFVNRKK